MPKQGIAFAGQPSPSHRPAAVCCCFVRGSGSDVAAAAGPGFAASHPAITNAAPGGEQLPEEGVLSLRKLSLEHKSSPSQVWEVGQEGKRLAWLKWDLLVKLESKKKMLR